MREKGSISRLFCAHWGERNPPAAARKALEASIPGLAKASIPIDVEAAAKCVGIEQIINAQELGCDGLLSVTPSGTYVVTLGAGQSASRRRFTVAHEVGHAIVFRSIGSRNEGGRDARIQCRTTTADERDEEHLCDVVAAELLMPREQFLQTMDLMGVSAAAIPAIAQRFGVSLHASCRRIAQLSPYDIGIYLWTLNPDGSRLVPKWLVTKKGTTTLQHVIQLGEPGSECFTDQIVRGWHWVPLQAQMEKYFVDVSPLGSGSRAWLVVAVLDSAAQHIFANMSQSRPHLSTTQIELLRPYDSG